MSSPKSVFDDPEYMKTLIKRYHSATDAARASGTTANTLNRYAKKFDLKWDASRTRDYHQPPQAKLGRGIRGQDGH